MKKLIIDDHHVVGESVHMSPVSSAVKTTATTIRLHLAIN
jgi:hypothetical protein